MTKTKTNNNIHRPLVITGYTLFILLLIAVLISTTIPMGMMLFNPRVLHYNVAVLAVALTIGALLPFLVGYLIGDRSTKSKNKINHHFNGVLFGLLGYWTMTLSTVFIMLPAELFGDDVKTRVIVANIIPTIITGAIAIILATMHNRSRHAKGDVIDYKPFSLVLIGSIVLMVLSSIVNNFVTNSVGFYTFIGPAVLLVLGPAVYVSLRGAKLTTYAKATWTAVSLSVAFMALFVTSLLAHDVSNYFITYPTMETQSATSIIGALLGIAGWLIYWIKQVKLLRLSINGKK